MSEIQTAYYLRLRAVDQPGVLAEITRILGSLQISIEAIRQPEPAAGAATVPIIILTHKVREAAMDEAIRQIEERPEIEGHVTRYRMETFA